MSSRFRPTSFRVAFGNTTDQEEVAVNPPPPSPSPDEPPRAIIQEVDIRPVRISSVADAEFEQIVVRETSCRQCNCYHCAYRQRMNEHKLNLILLILLVMFVVLVVHVSSKST